MSEEYRLSQYQDFGRLDNSKNIHLKRRITDGRICVEKHVPVELANIYRFLQRVQDRHIPQMYECIIQNEQLIVIEEYIEGQTIEDIINVRNISEEEAAYIILELCEGLKPLHHAEPPIICRDLKAENIMVDNKHGIKIIDFNIARSVQKGKSHDTVFMGTAGYAAPEQFGFSQTDNRTDIYALGVLLNYMLVKQFPIERIASGKLAPVIQKCIHIDSEKRYQYVEELEKDLIQTVHFMKSKGNVYQVNMKESSRTGQKSSFIPPGFRNRKPTHIFSAIAGYLFVIWFCFSLELTENGSPMGIEKLRLEQTIILLSQIFMIFIIWDYRGWKEKIPLIKNENIWIRIIGYIFAELILIITAAFFCVVLEAVLF